MGFRVQALTLTVLRSWGNQKFDGVLQEVRTLGPPWVESSIGLQPAVPMLHGSPVSVTPQELTQFQPWQLDTTRTAGWLSKNQLLTAEAMEVPSTVSSW